MSKKALVIHTNILLEKKFTGFVTKDFHDYLSIINNAEHQKFLERFEKSPGQEKPAEEDPTHQQVVPYSIILFNGKIFLYERAPPGVNDEVRLASKLSIGIGGHIEPIDDPNKEDNIVVLTLKREIQEELGHFKELFIDHKGYINLSDTDVESVHFGLVFLAEIKEHNFKLENQLVRGEFKTIEEIKSPEIYNRLENWSKVLVDNIHKIL